MHFFKSNLTGAGPSIFLNFRSAFANKEKKIVHTVDVGVKKSNLNICNSAKNICTVFQLFISIFKIVRHATLGGHQNILIISNQYIIYNLWAQFTSAVPHFFFLKEHFFILGEKGYE